MATTGMPGHGQGDARADACPGHPAGRRKEKRLDEELAADMGARGAERPAQPDLRPALEHGDDHHVGDTETAGQDGNGAQAEEQGGLRVLYRDPGGERIRRAADLYLFRVIRPCRGREQGGGLGGLA